MTLRQGRNSRLKDIKAGEPIRSHRSVPIAPTAPRRQGTNAKKAKSIETVKNQAKRKIRKSGLLRGSWKVFRVLSILTLVIGGLGSAGWAGYQWFESNDFMALRQVDVIGNHLVNKNLILDKAGLELGTKLPSAPVKLAMASLQSIPGIGEVEVKRIFPSRIEIRIKEKEPLALGFSKSWYGLAADGTRIPGIKWEESDLPIIDGFARLDSLRRLALGNFLQGAKEQYPDLYSTFSQMTLTQGRDGLEIIPREGNRKYLFSLEHIESNENEKLINGNKSLNSLEFLQALLHQQGSNLTEGKTVDLRVEGYAYVR